LKRYLQNGLLFTFGGTDSVNHPVFRKNVSILGVLFISINSAQSCPMMKRITSNMKGREV